MNKILRKKFVFILEYEGGTTEAIHCLMFDDNLKQIAWFHSQ